MLQCPWYVGLQQPFFAVDITLSVKAVGKKLEIVIEASLLYYNGFGFFSVGQITKMCKLLWKRERVLATRFWGPPRKPISKLRKSKPGTS